MKFNQQLNPKLWNDDNTLKEEVADKLLEIANAFMEFLEVPEDSVQDILLVGSSANYNYTKFSDIDVHLIVDYDKVHEDCPLVQGYLWAFKTIFNDEHDITIHDIPVELYAEDSNTPRISNGVYSLMSNEWLSKPEKIEITVDDSAVKKKYEELKETIDKTDDSEKAIKLLRKIYDMRKSGLHEEGEFSIENLAFKELRNNKDIDKLWELKRKDVDDKLSLNESQFCEDNIRTVDLTDLFDEDPTMDEVKEVLDELFNEKSLIPTASFGWSISIDVRDYAKKHIIYPRNFNSKLPNGQLNPKRYKRSQRISHNKVIIQLRQIIENCIYCGSDKVNDTVKMKKEKQPVQEYVYFRVDVKIGHLIYHFKIDTELYKNDKITFPTIVHMYNIEECKKPTEI